MTTNLDRQAIRRDLENAVLKAHLRAYDGACSVWREVDTKAQGTITVAGIFVAATFGVLTRFPSHFSQSELWALRTNLVALVASVGCGIGTLWLRKFDYPATGDEVTVRMNALYSLEAGKDKTDERFSEVWSALEEWADGRWRESIKGVEGQNHNKSKWLLAAQVCLVVAIVASAVLTSFLAK